MGGPDDAGPCSASTSRFLWGPRLFGLRQIRARNGLLVGRGGCGYAVPSRLWLPLSCRWSLDLSQTLASEIAAWQQQRNASGARIQWMFNAERARQKMERLYPSPLIAAPLAA